jgi:hypothetical protein
MSEEIDIILQEIEERRRKKEEKVEEVSNIPIQS